MRTDQIFIDRYRESLRSVDPRSADLPPESSRALALTELCLHFLSQWLPDEDSFSVPFLMLGYPVLLGSALNHPGVKPALAALRHTAYRYRSFPVWLEACRQHKEFPETFRCYDVVNRRPVPRKSAPEQLVNLLTAQLQAPTPWVQRRLLSADPGEARVRVNRGRTLLAYQVPAVTAQDRAVQKHALSPRKGNLPIQISLDDMKAIAQAVDQREASKDWPLSLPRLNLEKRLENLNIEGVQPGLFDGRTLTLDGAVHLVGMLSSGKSTLVMGLLFALTLGGTGKRIAVLVSDTIQGATLAARLRKHGVKATVLSSLYNRERHLSAIHWQQGLTRQGNSLLALGDIAQSFSAACPLDGLQAEPIAVRGDKTSAWFPAFKEKQCHRILQKVPSDEVGMDQEDYDEQTEDVQGRSCPLWKCCPAQEQQRSAVDAQVLIMTPQAFLHMAPDKWTSDHHLTMPELLQYIVDLVIIDEVDGVQKVLDDSFAPRSPIMGDERDVYAPSIGMRTSEALRERSGAQFRRATNARWQSNFHTFFRLIGVIYALLQNERSQLRPFFANNPFTAASILYELWRKRHSERELSAMTFDNPEFERKFLQFIKVATSITKFSRSSSAGQDEADEEIGAEDETSADSDDGEFRAAIDGLQEIARQVIVSDYYDNLIEPIVSMLDGPLALFRVSTQRIEAEGSKNKAGKAGYIDSRTNALAILLAVVTELALTHYNWLIKVQPGVARDFGIDEAELLSQANNLIKHYRTLLPSNPAGAVFGLLYDEPPDEKWSELGGKLTLINHLGVGRYLVAHLHDLLLDEGQTGPHVLMLSGTSWAGGSQRRRDPTGKFIDAASPIFDVQVPVKGILLQPVAELDAIAKSVFALVNIRTSEGKQVRVSGKPERERRQTLRFIAERLAIRRDDLNIFAERWHRMALRWGAGEIENRRRALLVVHSYADAVAVADTLMITLEAQGYSDWRVLCLSRDRADDTGGDSPFKPMRARELPRSLIERFGEEPENSILVAPIQIVARGHNILNSQGKAAISSIYFLHRPHPRPDDLGPIIGRLNRYALERFTSGTKLSTSKAEDTLSVRARRMRYAASNIVRYSLDNRSGYSGLSAEYKAQFAWDMITPIWQTVGRGIRGGCPVFIGFVDRQFAPLSFDGGEGAKDTGHSSALVQAMHQLTLAMDPTGNPTEYKVAQLLYGPFCEALRKTEGLIHG